ncbi:hypothetical protein GBAR_LOCUS14115 [Geodia barretti]|uniref:Uncharacterized protein n=1 Tax=Geodia barretti TaxID=519541 RepID=A0AA35S8X0_GEOBA|nr:hypothetical protein GBAR_LOCUS14115 [Geodia barretti]
MREFSSSRLFVAIHNVAVHDSSIKQCSLPPLDLMVGKPIIREQLIPLSTPPIYLLYSVTASGFSTTSRPPTVWRERRSTSTVLSLMNRREYRHHSLVMPLYDLHSIISPCSSALLPQEVLLCGSAVGCHKPQTHVHRAR